MASLYASGQLRKLRRPGALGEEKVRQDLGATRTEGKTALGGQRTCEEAWLLYWRTASGSEKCGAGSGNALRAAQSSRQINNDNLVSSTVELRHVGS